MAKVPADLHIHIDNNITKERVIKILKAAEENGLKAICILEHNNINLYKRGGILEELLIEGIEKYYTGKIISGVELNCTIKQAPVSAKTGIDYNGYDMHILMYGFNPKELRKKVDWFNEEVDAVRYYSDVDTLLSKLASLRLPLPPKSHFRFAEGVKPFKQLYKYIEESPNKEVYTSVLGDYPHSSAFVRNLAYSPTSKIYFDRAQSPSIVDVIDVGKECAALLTVAYPYHINRKLIKDIADYIDTLQSIPTKTKTRNFNSVEGPYMLNTEDETGEIINYAKTNNLMVTAGSDYQPQDKMYYLPPDATEKIWYAPAPGLYVRQLFDGGKGLLTIEEEFLNILPDIRDYKYYRVATAIDRQKEMQAQAPVQEPTPQAPVAEEAAPVQTAAEVAPTTEEVVSPITTQEKVAEETESAIEEMPAAPVIEDISEAMPEAPIAEEETSDDSDDIEGGQTPVIADIDEEVVDTPEIEDIEDITEEDNSISSFVEENAEQMSEAPISEEIEETVEEVVEKPAPKKAPAKKPAAKKPAPKKESKKQEPAADALDDTLSLLEQLTNDIE